MSPETEKRLYLPENLELDNPFWQFSLDVWRLPEARKRLLACQDELALRVSQLLFSAWLAKHCRLLVNPCVKSVPDLYEWQTRVVDRLRSCRMLLPTDRKACEVLKRQLQETELLAEQLEIAWLYACFESQSQISATGNEGLLMLNFINYTRGALGIESTCPLPANVMCLLQSLVISLDQLGLDLKN
jgi:uncharacterized protein (TIGR02444 family)